MDLILMGFSKTHLAGLNVEELGLYDQLLSENDHDLYQWVSKQTVEPENYRGLMDMIREGAIGVTKSA